MPRPLWRRLLKPALVIAALAVVFGWLLPQFIDYEEVWDALTELDGWEVVVLLGLGLARVPTEALMYRAFLPGLGLVARKRGVPLLELRRAAAPASERERRPVRLLPRRRLRAGRRRARGARLVPLPDDRPVSASARRARAAARHRRGQRLDPAGGRALARDHGRRGHRRLRLPARRALGALARSEAATSALLDPREAQARSDRGRSRKGGATPCQALAVLREGWALGSIGVAANLFLTYLILLAALRFVGVSSAELSAADAFAAFAIAFWAGAVFPITGSGLGVVDAVLIAVLIELGSASDDALVAAALLWRVFYSVIALPLGAITLSRFRKANPEVSAALAARARH